jgi:glycyl-tRNA synthetase beta chain
MSAMSTTKNLLVELFVEELPPKALASLGEAFRNAVFNGLSKSQLVVPGAIVATIPFASPRRLAVFIPNVLSKAADRVEPHKLMPVAVGIDANGSPTPALLKKLASFGKDASAAAGLRRQVDGKTECLVLDHVVEGRALADGLQDALKEAIAKLPIPKVMQYQLDDGWTSVKFVRPAHGLVALHGADLVPVSVLGLQAGRTTRGHRFEAEVDPVVLRDADSYPRQLESEGAVIASFAQRRDEITRQLNAAAAAAGAPPIDDDALLDEVTGLVERPNVLTCQFEREFLQVPQECLILTMKANQKYFPLLDAQGGLTNRFLVVSNIRPDDPSAVIGGNERVVRPRLTDAKFFYDQDRKKKLVDRVEGLAKVVYHAKLGTQRERVERVCRIARDIAQRLGGDALAEKADRAALLAKADLLTDMVGEFPELQGTMGRYYAEHDGEPQDVAWAIEDHYKPRFAGDALPRNDVGIAVALADKLETLVGLFGIGQVPTGDKDPFALRRQALGIARMLIERELPLAVDELIDTAFAAFPPGMLRDAKVELETFFYERLAGLLRERGFSAAEIDAVTCLRPARLDLVPKQLAAVRAFAALPEAASLAAANKRVGNILKKSDAPANPSVDPRLLSESAEQGLSDALRAIAPQADAAFDRGDYTASLQALAALRAPVDAFFDNVMVNVDDAALRSNRLGLLASLHAAMNRVADLSKLAG